VTFSCLLQLDFPDHAFDTLVVTFVLLCVPEYSADGGAA
jgi:hypothetical protein